MNNYHIWKVDPKPVTWKMGTAEGTTPKDALRAANVKSPGLFLNGDVVVVANHDGQHNGVGIFKIRKAKADVEPAILQVIDL
jgi:hypothetical protein